MLIFFHFAELKYYMKKFLCNANQRRTRPCFKLWKISGKYSHAGHIHICPKESNIADSQRKWKKVILVKVINLQIVILNLVSSAKLTSNGKVGWQLWLTELQVGKRGKYVFIVVDVHMYVPLYIDTRVYKQRVYEHVKLFERKSWNFINEVKAGKIWLWFPIS